MAPRSIAVHKLVESAAMNMHPVSRRHFLRTSAATTCGLLVAPALLRAEDPKNERFGPFTIGVQSYTFREFDLEQCLKRMKELGLHYGEFYTKHIPFDSSPDQIKAILKTCKDYDVTPAGYGVLPFTKNHEANKKAFQLGKALGLKYLSADPTEDAFDSLDKLCDEYKIAIAIHPHGPSGKKLHRWYSAEIILKAVKDHNELIGTCLDTGHLIRAAILGEKLDPAQQIRLMGKRNFAIHLKDNDNEAEKKGDPDSNVVFGKGALDVEAALKALKDVGFKGTIEVEYESHPKDPMPDMKECLAVLEKAA
jgi:sugar phosphate isomerase/epimerase